MAWPRQTPESIRTERTAAVGRCSSIGPSRGSQPLLRNHSAFNFCARRRFLEIGAGLHFLLAIDERVRHAENGGHHGPSLRIPNVAVILDGSGMDFHIPIRNVHVSSRRLGRNQFDLHFASE